MLGNDKDIRTLNSLIATTIDSVHGYEESAKDAQGGRFGEIFTQRAQERRQIVQQLKSAVTSMGGEPEDDGTALAGAHRAFLNLKSTVTGQDDAAVIAEVERGEDHIKAKFESALEDRDLTPQTRSAIEQAYGSVRQGHDQISAIKHGLEAAR